MPELPEVETTRRGIAPHVEGHLVSEVIVRQPRLRWPVPPRLGSTLRGQQIHKVERRGKYLLFEIGSGTLLVHLGMSGSLRVTDSNTPADKHDHVDIVLDDGRCLRLHDPRRFGAVLWTRQPAAQHDLLKQLGPEPLSEDFNTDYLLAKARGKKLNVKAFIMDSKVVVGVGNIYANEALFMAGINPKTTAGRISKARYDRVVEAIKQVLAAAIKQGGTTLRDFVNGDGKPGYFQQQLQIYGRAGDTCHGCGTAIRLLQLGQRATYYCPRCQR